MRGGSGAEELVRWERIAVEKQDSFVIEAKLWGLPGDLGGIESLGFVLLRPAEQAGHVDGLHRLDVVGWFWRRGNVDDPLPHAVESEEELDFLGPAERAVHFHEPLAARADERVFAPNAEDEIAPEGTEVAGARCGGSWHTGRLITICRVLPRLDFHAAALVGVAAVIPDGVLVLGWDMFDGGGEELRGGEDLEVALGAPAAAGAVDDAAGLFHPSDLFEREGGAEEILRELLTARDAANGPLSGINAESAVFPVQKLAGLTFADDLLVEQGRDEAVPEEFGERLEGLDRHFVEASVAVVEAGSGQEVEMGMEDEVVSEGLYRGDSGELPVGKIEAGAEPGAQALDGGAAEEGEQVTPSYKIGRASRMERV